jgi:enhancing lycopene biosynthesis protein 2
MGKKIAVILSGCGVFDGSEIHESVFALLAIVENGGTYQCFAPDIEQHHVLNHMNGEELKEKRNVLVESARIARGDIKPLNTYEAKDFDGLVLPGGFGAAKNLTKWAFSGPDGEINADVKKAILTTIQAKQPVVGLCMGPTVIAKALEGSAIKPQLTVGTTNAQSPYEIAAISTGMEKTGAKAEMKTIEEISVDVANRIITAPCYMMEADILQVRKNVKQAVDAMFSL